jgi:hypothetical protein
MEAVSLFKEGRFQQTVLGPRSIVVEPTLAAWEGDWAKGSLDSTWWHDGTQALRRESCPATLEGTILRGVLPGSMIVIEGQRYECPNGGDVDLSFQYVGEYVVWVSLWPYLDGRYVVENPPSTE